MVRSHQISLSLSAMLHSLLQDSVFDPGLLQPPSDAVQVGWRETTNAHVFEIELPGLTKEDVKLQLQQGSVLHICSTASAEERPLEEEIKGEIKWHCKERMKLSDGFSKEFRLPDDAKVDEIKASMRDGLVIVIVPKHHHRDHSEHNNSNNKKKRNKHYAVKITGPSGDSTNGDVNEDHHPSKGRLGRFVCWKT